MVKVPLKTLCEIEITDGTHKTPTYSDEGYIFLSSKNVTNEVIDWDNIMYIPEELHNELYRRIAPKKDDILLAKNGTTGVAAIVDRDEIFDIYVSLALIRPDKNKVYPRYLLHAINSSETRAYFNSHLKGIGVPNLHLTHIRETPIPIPSIEQQKKIALILDKVSDLIALRKQQLAKLDELVKARFVEMFGDVKTNSQSWTECRIEQACSMVVDCVNKTAPTVDYETPYKMIRTTNVKKGRIKTDAVKYVEKDIFEKWTRRVVPQKGDIILTREAPMGEVGIIDTDEMVFLGQRLVLYRVDPRLMNAKYLMYLLMSDYFQEQVISKGKGSTVKHLPVPDCTEFKVLVPDVKLQQRFAIFVEQTDKSKSEIQTALTKLETLKKALMQQYFG